MSEVSRRDSLKLVGGAVAGLVVGGVAGYFAGSSTAPTKVETMTTTVGGTTSTITVPTTVTQAAAGAGAGESYAFVGHWTAGPFAGIVQNGFNAAIKELGANGDFEMSNGDTSKQVDLIEAAVAKKVNGIATTLVDPTAFNKPVQDALNAGIPVVAANSDVPGNPRLAFLGQTFYTAGLGLGTQVAKVATAAGVNMSQQKAAIFTSFITSPWHAQRGKGIRDALAAAGVDPKNITDVDCVSEEMATAERIQTAYIVKNRDFKLFFGTDAIVTDRFASSAKSAGLDASSVYFGGFDVTDATMSGIDSGYVTATITQQPYLQAYYAVYQLHIIHKYGFSGTDMDTGKGLVDKSNVDTFRKLVPQGIMG